MMLDTISKEHLEFLRISEFLPDLDHVSMGFV